MNNQPAHSLIGASSSERWFNCPGSVELIKVSPPQESSIHAERGTAAHTVVEKCLGEDKDPWDFEGMEFPGGELNQEDIQAVEDAIEWVEEKIEWVCNTYGNSQTKLEARFDLSDIYPGLFGTADIVIWSDDLSYLGVFDYKHGKGVSVDVIDNKQLKYYALGAIVNVLPDSFKVLGFSAMFKHVEIGILQPRAYHPDGPFRTWKFDGPLINNFAQELKQKAEDTAKPRAKLKEGSHCKWCPALAICPQIYNQQQEIVKQDFSKIKGTPQLTDPVDLTPGKLAQILAFEDLMGDYFKSVRAFAKRELEHGRKVPGYKLVQRRANRKWKDESAVADLFVGWEEQIYTKKLLSPAQLEKKLGKVYSEQKEEIQQLIKIPDAGLTRHPP